MPFPACFRRQFRTFYYFPAALPGVFSTTSDVFSTTVTHFLFSGCPSRRVFEDNYKLYTFRMPFPACVRRQFRTFYFPDALPGVFRRQFQTFYFPDATSGVLSTTVSHVLSSGCSSRRVFDDSCTILDSNQLPALRKSHHSRIRTDPLPKRIP